MKPENLLKLLITVIVLVVVIFISFSIYAIVNLNSEGQNCVANPFIYYMVVADISSCSCLQGNTYFTIYQNGVFERDIERNESSLKGQDADFKLLNTLK